MYEATRDILMLLSGIMLTLVLSFSLKKRKILSAFASRKLLHTGAIGICAIAPQTSIPYPWLLAVIIPASLVLFWLVYRHKFMSVPGMHSGFGIALFTLPLMAMLALQTEADLISLSMGVLAISDSAAALAGRYKTTWNIPEGKTLRGSLVFFISCVVILLGYFFLTQTYFSALALFSILTVSLGCTAAEAFSKNGWDNVSIPVFILLFLPFVRTEDQQSELIILGVLSVFFFLFSTHKKLLTPTGAFWACVTGTYTALTCGYAWLLPLIALFGGSAILSKLFPHQTHSDPKSGKARDHMQVWSNGGVFLVAAILGELSFISLDTVEILMLSSISVATADTWSSEIGMYFKGKTYDAFRWKPMNPGLSGGMSLQGTLAGMAGAFLITWCGWMILPESDFNDLELIFLSGCIGMYLDSLMGSILQGKYTDPSGEIRDYGSQLISGYVFVTNDLVNLLSNALTVTLVYLLLM